MQQSPYELIGSASLYDAVQAFHGYLSPWFQGNHTLPVEFSYERLDVIISSTAFEKIPEINKLNESKMSTGKTMLFVDKYSNIDPDHDFIDLGALSRNVFYMVLREAITHG